MDLQWSLKELYPSFESEEFRRDLAACDATIANLQAWADGNLGTADDAGRKLEECLQQFIELHKTYNRLFSYGRLSRAANAKDEQAAQTVEKMQRYGSVIRVVGAKFEKWVGRLTNLEELLAASPMLAEHRFYLYDSLLKAEHYLSDEEENIIAQMTNTGSQAFNTLYQMLTSTLMVDILLDGEAIQLPLSAVRNMAFDKNQEVRRTAFEAERAAYPKIDKAVAACLNGIKGQAITLAKLRKYESNLSQTLSEYRMDEQTLQAMLTAMRESLPAFRRYFRRKAELLGHTDGLPFYDAVAPMGKVDMTFTYEEACEYITKNFRTFSDKLADFAQHAFVNRWIDVEPREGKQGGAFCSNLGFIGESRILTNFNGSFGSVATLAHELGHAYHGNCLLKESPLNRTYTMPIAETASIFTETIIFNAALKSAARDEAFAILEKSISNAAQVIVDILSRFLFESEVFHRREDHSLSVNELNEIMMNAQKEAYGEGLDPACLHPYAWIPKGHYYYPDLNFYNFPYAFGLLFAKGIYAEYLRRGEEFVPEFDRLLAATGKNTIADVAKMVNIDVTSVAFWRSSLQVIQEDIERFMALSEEM